MSRPPRLYHRVQNRLARFGHANGEFADRIIEAICDEIEEELHDIANTIRTDA